MRAAFCTAPRTIELRDVGSARPGPDEVLVRVRACGICGSDLHYFCGGAPPPDVPLGHEIAGRVAAVGARQSPREDIVTPLEPGIAVVVEPLIACGACDRCRAGEPNLCARLRILGALAPGGMAEYVVVPASSVYPVPAALDLETAALAEPLAVGIHAVGLGQIALGTEVLVLGGGAIGLLAAFAARCAGGRVVVAARYEHQRAMARALGAATAIAAPAETVLAATARARPDVVLESVGGTADTLDLALEAVRAGGRIVALGKFTTPIRLAPLRFLMKEVHLVSSMTYRRSPRPDFMVALDLLMRERDRLRGLITHRVPLEDVARGFAIAADKTSGAIKVVVDVAT